MKYLKYLPFLLFLFLINTGCEIKNSPVEMLLIESSDSVALSGDTVKFYCQAQDSDGDKISYSWESSGGSFLVQKDTAYWIAPNQSGHYNITCKVSDGVGSSDALTLSVKVAGKMLKGKVSNAVNGNGVANTLVSIDNNSAITDEDGNYEMYFIFNVGQYSVNATNDQFCPFDGLFSIPEGYSQNTYEYNMSVSPFPEPGETRMVLNWGLEPSDLDSHLKTPEIEGQTYHVMYSNKGSADQAPFALLDIDDTSGYGPETFTIRQSFSGTYVYYIYQFSSSGSLAESNGTIKIYNSPECDGETIIVPNSGEGRYWYVCDIDGESGEVTIVNEIQNSEPGQ
jgi:uncharacterized protein YfaP (DUF2135 family)